MECYSIIDYNINWRMAFEEVVTSLIRDTALRNQGWEQYINNSTTQAKSHMLFVRQKKIILFNC